MRIKIISLCLLLSAFLQTTGQGISFFEGDYAAALEKAKAEGKMVFIDFYADWCGPCKKMAQEVFTDQGVGEYFNRHFVSLQVDTENPDNRSLVKHFKVTSLPTLSFINTEGKMVYQSLGAMPAADFIQQAKIATGEALSFDALYDKLKSSKNDLNLMQQALIAAPSYVSALDSKMERDKWVARIEKLFKDYISRKMGPELINAADYKIIMTFHQPDKPGDKIMEFINENIPAYLENVGQGPAYYVVEYNDRTISNLARSGKQEYKKYLERINGDMKAAYDAMPGKVMTPYERNSFYYDAEYELFYHKNAEKYVQLMEQYLKALGEDVTALDYGGAAQKIYQATGGKVSDDVLRKAKEWTIQALQFTDIPLLDKVNFLVMLGDNHKTLKEYEEARKCYNQAFMEAMQISQEMTKTMAQMTIKRKLAELDLLR